MNSKKIQIEELPAEASVALERSGKQLLRQLATMREQESAEIDLEALDPHAELALHQRGDELLERLESERRATAIKPTKWRNVVRFAIAAAAVIAAMAATGFFASPEQETPQLVKHSTPVDPTDPNTAPMTVPEPSGTLLTMCGLACLLFRRQR